MLFPTSHVASTVNSIYSDMFTLFGNRLCSEGISQHIVHRSVIQRLRFLYLDSVKRLTRRNNMDLWRWNILKKFLILLITKSVKRTHSHCRFSLSLSLFFFLLSCPKIEANPDTVGVINSTQRWTICTDAAGASGWHMQVSQAARLPRGENRAAETQLLYPASVLYWLQLGTR